MRLVYLNSMIFFDHILMEVFGDYLDYGYFICCELLDNSQTDSISDYCTQELKTSFTNLTVESQHIFSYGWLAQM